MQRTLIKTLKPYPVPNPDAQGSGLCLVLLTGSPDSFFRLSEARTAMEAELRDGGRLQVQ